MADPYGLQGLSLADPGLEGLSFAPPQQSVQEQVRRIMAQRAAAQQLAQQQAADQQLIAQSQQVQAVPQSPITPTVAAPTAAPTPAPTAPTPGVTTPAPDDGWLGNAWNAVKQSFAAAGTDIAAGAATASGDTALLAKLAKSQQAAEKEAPAPLQAFRKASQEPSGSLWTDLSNTAKAAVEHPQGAVDAALGVVTGFVPMIAGTVAGGAAGSAVPFVGNLAGAAGGAALTSAEMELGGKALQHLRQAAVKAKVDLDDDQAVAKWLKDGGAEEVFGPAWKAAATTGAITLLTMGVAGKLGLRADKLAQSLQADAAVGAGRASLLPGVATEATLRQGLRQATAGELGTVVGGFGAASALADLAAGDEVNARDVMENALTLLLPGGAHAAGRYKGIRQARKFDEIKPEVAAKAAAETGTADTELSEADLLALAAARTPPETKAAPTELTQEELDARVAQSIKDMQRMEAELNAAKTGDTEAAPPDLNALYERMGVAPLDTKDGVRTELGDLPRLGAKSNAAIDAVAAATTLEEKIAALRQFTEVTTSAKATEAADALIKKLEGQSAPEEATRAMLEPRDTEDAVTALSLVQDIAKEVQSEIVTEAQDQVRSEIAARQAERAAAAAAAAAAPQDRLGPISPLAAGAVRRLRRGTAAAERSEPPGYAAVLPVAGGEDQVRSAGGSGTGLGQEVADAGAALESQRGQQAGDTGGNQQATAAGPVVPGSDAGGTRSAGTEPQVRKLNDAYYIRYMTDEMGFDAKTAREEYAADPEHWRGEVEDAKRAEGEGRQAGTALTEGEQKDLAREEVVKAHPNNDPDLVRQLRARMADEARQQSEGTAPPPDTSLLGRLKSTFEKLKTKPGADIMRLTKLLGPALYGNPDKMTSVSVKEIFQNSFDSIKPLLQTGKLKQGKIDITTDANKRTLTFVDNGTGMEPNILGTKFLEIAGTRKEGERSSGGLGVAKMQFLYANKDIEVVTLRDGVLSTLRSTGPELELGMGHPDLAPDIHIKRGVKTTPDFPDGHGTKITVTIPTEWKNEVTGEHGEIEFPTDLGSYPVLKKSPLLEPIDVRFNGDKVFGIGADFPKDEHTHFLKVKFPWGTADVYVTKNEEERYGSNVHVLSNGLWQFDLKLAKNPNDRYSDPIPRQFYINIDAKAQPTDPGYPFALNRQSFSETTREGFERIMGYLGALHRKQDMSNDAKNFGRVEYLTPGLKGIKSSGLELLEPKSKPKDDALNSIRPGDQVEVVDGKLVVRGREVPELTPEQLKGEAINLDEFKVDHALLRPDAVMLHDNLDVPVDPPLSRDELRARMRAAEKAADQGRDDRDAGKITDEELTPILKADADASEAYYAGSQEPKEFKSIVELGRKEFGPRFDQFVYGVGNVFHQLRNAVADVLDYPELRNEVIGISFDKQYRGVSTRIPFSGSFLNVAVPESLHPSEAGLGYFFTMIHELAHHKQRNHDEKFPAEMQRIMYKLEAANPGVVQAAKKTLVGYAERNHDIIKFLNERNINEYSRTRGKQFKSGDYERGDEHRSQDVAGLGQARQPIEGVPGRPAERTDATAADKLRRGAGAAAPVPAPAPALGHEPQQDLLHNTPHSVIKGIDSGSGLRQSVAYHRGNGTYDYYKTTAEEPRGDPETKVPGLTRAEIFQRMAADGHRPEYAKGADWDKAPATTKSALQGWKDGALQFLAHAIKGEDGKPTGAWKITEGADIQDKASPTTQRTVENYDAMLAARNGGNFTKTKRQSEALAKQLAAEANPTLKYRPPGQVGLTMADRENPLKYLGQQAKVQAEAAGRTLPESQRPDLANTRKISAIDNDVEKLQHERVKPLEKEGRKLLSRFKRSGAEFDKDITALAYLDRSTNMLADARYDATPDLEQLVRIQQDAARQHLDALPADYRTALEAYAKKWKAVSDAMLDYKAKNGLIPQAEATRIKNAQTFYVPMRTDLKSTVGKRATGASDESTHPLLRIVSDWHNAIKQNYENREALATYELAENHNIVLPDGSKLFDLAPLLEYKVDPDTGDVIRAVEPLTMDKNSVTVLRDGKPYRMRVNDKDFNAALQRVPANDTHRAINTAMHGMAMFNALYGGLKTAASPVFAVKNVARDVPTAFAQADQRVSRRELAKSLVRPYVWAAAIQNAAEPWTGKRGGAFEQAAQQAGAYISRRGQYGLQSHIDQPHVNLDPSLLQRAGGLRRGLFSFEHGKVMNVLTFATKLGENITRGAVFDAATRSPRLWESVGRDNGMNGAAVETALRKASAGQTVTPVERALVNHLLNEAGVSAKTATVNFEPKGRVSGLMNALYVFANAKVQGARTYAERMGFTGIKGGDTMLQRLKLGNRYTQGATAAALGAGMATAFFGYKNDPEKYSQLSDYQKDDYLIFKSGGFSPPIPQEIGWAYILGQSLVDAKMNPRWADPAMRQAKAATRFGTGVMQSFWPGGSSMSDPVGGAQGTTSQYLKRLVEPTLATPLLDIASNQNTFGSQIVHGLNDKGVPANGKPLYVNNADRVSPLAREATSVLHKVGVMDAAPESAQYLINQYFKTQIDAAHIAPTWEAFDAIFGKAPTELDGKERPNAFMRTFFQTASPLATKNDLEEIKQHEVAKAYDAGDPKSPTVNMLKRGEAQSKAAFTGYEKMTPEQRQRAAERAETIRGNTLKKYRDQQTP